MKKLLSLLTVVGMLTLYSATAFAQATIIFDGQPADGITSTPVDNGSAGTVTVVHSRGNVVSTSGSNATVVTGNGNVTVTKSPTGERVDRAAAPASWPALPTPLPSPGVWSAPIR